jgi:hypothetical protein
MRDPIRFEIKVDDQASKILLDLINAIDAMLLDKYPERAAKTVCVRCGRDAELVSRIEGVPRYCKCACGHTWEP